MDPKTTVGFTWADYVDGLVAREGTWTAVAEKLAASRGFEEDVGSIERALRRLHGRGLEAGGKWGARAIALFGLPESLELRLRWMGIYHSTFTDLPVPICEDLIRLWDHPPTTDQNESRVWLALAKTSVALRRQDDQEALRALRQAELGLEHAPVEARLECLLVLDYLNASREPHPEAWLGQFRGLLRKVKDPFHRACFQVRFTDQVAHRLNGLADPPFERVASSYEAIETSGAPPFVLSRRANGLAYVSWKLGRKVEALALARAAAEHAADGGHVRLRAMALGMIARIDPSEREARDRAMAMSARLEDETLLFRLRRPSRKPSP